MYVMYIRYESATAAADPGSCSRRGTNDTELHQSASSSVCQSAADGQPTEPW